MLPDADIVQRSPVPVVRLGDIALGGGLLIVVSIDPFDVTVLFVSVLITSSSSACAMLPISKASNISKSFISLLVLPFFQLDYE